jgi:hypothetical protein
VALLPQGARAGLADLPEDSRRMLDEARAPCVAHATELGLEVVLRHDVPRALCEFESDAAGRTEFKTESLQAVEFGRAFRLPTLRVFFWGRARAGNCWDWCLNDSCLLSRCPKQQSWPAQITLEINSTGHDV